MNTLIAPSATRLRLGDERDAVGRPDGLDDGVDAVGVLDDDQQRAVDAGAETLGQPVVGNACGRTTGIVALVGDGEAHGEDGQAGEQQHCATGDAPPSPDGVGSGAPNGGRGCRGSSWRDRDGGCSAG